MSGAAGKGRRGRAERFGRWAEGAAAALLMGKGYRILARRHRSSLGEIDIVAARGDVVVAVEVKGRRGGGGAEAISREQRRRIEGALVAFVAARPELGRCDLRFDAVEVAPLVWPRHLVDAWRPGD